MVQDTAVIYKPLFSVSVIKTRHGLVEEPNARRWGRLSNDQKVKLVLHVKNP